MISGVTDPNYQPAPACEAFECKWRSFRADVCREAACPFLFQRAEAEDRKARELKDERARSGNA